jgi:hypothetical protein
MKLQPYVTCENPLIGLTNFISLGTIKSRIWIDSFIYYRVNVINVLRVGSNVQLVAEFVSWFYFSLLWRILFNYFKLQKISSWTQDPQSSHPILCERKFCIGISRIAGEAWEFGRGRIYNEYEASVL